MPELFNITWKEAVAGMQGDFSQLPKRSTRGLDQGDVELFIEEAVAELLGAMQNGGQGVPTDETALSQARGAVRAYVHAEIYKSRNHSGQLYQEARQKFERLIEKYSARPNLLVGAPDQFISNVDVDGEAAADPLGRRRFHTDYTW